jgi:predicted metal-dependent hydrolase
VVDRLNGARAFAYGGATIAYELRFARRKTLGIRVLPDGSVRVTAPQGAGLRAIEAVLLRKARWIARKQAEVAAHAPLPPYQYTSGETHLFLGRPVQLQVQQGPKALVMLAGRCLAVQTPAPADPLAVAALLERWQREQAEVVFAQELAAAARRVQPLGIAPPPTMRIRRMRTRWGSCTSRGAITLNLRLIQVERALIEYVLVHELCHLLEHNHSRAYYALLDRALPDWRGRKQQLNAARIG